MQTKSDEDFHILKTACVACAEKKLRIKILKTRNIHDLFQLFAVNHKHCNWLHVTFLEVIAAASENIELNHLIENYKSIVFSKTLGEVWEIHSYRKVKTKYYSKLLHIFHKDPDFVTVEELKRWCAPDLIKKIALAFGIIKRY